MTGPPTSSSYIFVLSILGAMRVSFQSRDREVEPLICAFHMALKLFRTRRQRSIGNPKEIPDSHSRS